MACSYHSFIYFYFLIILALQNPLIGQNQFGRIFKENANPLFRDNIKQDTVVKQNIVSEELFIQIDNIDTVAAGTEKAQSESSKVDSSTLDNPIIVNSLVLSYDPVSSKIEKNKTIPGKVRGRNT